MDGPFDFIAELRRSLKKNAESSRHEDVLMVSDKYLATAEGRYVKLDSVVPLADDVGYACGYGMSPSLVKTVLRESDCVLRGLHGFMLTIKEGSSPRKQGSTSPTSPRERPYSIRGMAPGSLRGFEESCW